MARAEPTLLPVIPHARGSVLLPGVVHRIPVSSTGSRPDIPAILANVYTRAASKAPNERIDTVPIACVPIASRLLGPDGQLLIDNGDESSYARDTDQSNLKKSDLFSYGVAAKIVGVEGRGTGEFALRIEGTVRVKIERVTQERPYFEAKVKYLPDQSKTTQLTAASMSFRVFADSRYQSQCAIPNSKTSLTP
jgi:ATP-dependent Lon protease